MKRGFVFLILFTVLLVLSSCSKPSSFSLYGLEPSEVTSIRLTYHTQEGDCSLEFNQENYLFDSVIEYLNAPFETVEASLDTVIVDPISVDLITEKGAVSIQMATFETKSRTKEMLCLIKDGVVYHLFNENASLRKLSGSAYNGPGTVSGVNANKAPLYAAFSFLDSNVFTDTVIRTGNDRDFAHCTGVLTDKDTGIVYDPVIPYSQVYEKSDLVVAGRVVSIQENTLRPIYNPLLQDAEQGGLASGLIADRYADITLEISQVYKGEAAGRCLITVPLCYTSDEGVNNVSFAQRRIKEDERLLVSLTLTDEVVVGGEYDLADMYFGILLLHEDQLIPLFNPAPELATYYPLTM